MRIILAPVGTRGDVQPLVALGKHLKKQKHEVVVAAPSNFREFVENADLEFRVGVGDYRTFMDALGTEPFLKVLARQIAEQHTCLLEASGDADAIVGCQLQVAGPSIAELRRIPYFNIHLSPVFIRSDDHPPVTVQSQKLGKLKNHAAWERRAKLWNRELKPSIELERKRFGLKQITDAQDFVLHRGHLLLCTEPALGGLPNYSSIQVHQTGTLYETDGELPNEIIDFCKAGEPPIFIGFGSMMFRPADELMSIFINAASKTRQRVVLGLGWAKASQRRVPKNCLVVKDVPYHKLFPLVKAAIHHGGSGTVSTVALAGIPQAIVPHFADQFYWAERLYQLGIGSRPVSIKNLTEDRLAGMIRQIDSEEMFRAAKKLARSINPSRGIRETAKRIISVASRGGSNA
jgi:vancomycin aglycone glucosyltransferase